jgi:plastocyanin
MKKYQFYVFMLGVFLTVPITQTYAENTSTFHSDVDTSPIEAVIMINENENKTTFFEPNTITVRVGSEIQIS